MLLSFFRFFDAPKVLVKPIGNVFHILFNAGPAVVLAGAHIQLDDVSQRLRLLLIYLRLIEGR